ncbi:peptidyl-prolyl cis-trans isomerase FKBP14 isoform X1 [Aphelocoma coerulescens]|uniref:peptidyl-prolyl cis-trans isomerase FKBP14 isoform X1 n=1 Tax=Aphelocoma coerulescens TaxID=39617 RepID=UPI0036052E33
MALLLCSALLCAALGCAGAALIPPAADVKVEVLHKPFLCHRKTKWGDMMLVHYEGFLERDGSMFHSTHKHNNGQPMWFTLGIREALKGWDRGLKDMCVGEKRKLTIPPALAYGKEGKGKIPPESTLIFNIDLLEIRNGPRSHESFQEMDLNDDWKLSKQEGKLLECQQEPANNLQDTRGRQLPVPRHGEEYWNFSGTQECFGWLVCEVQGLFPLKKQTLTAYL